MENPLTFAKWFRSIWSERDGSGSSTRVDNSIVTYAGVFIAVWLVIVNKSAAHLFEVATFVLMIRGAMYGINRHFNNKDQQQKAQPEQGKS